MDPAGWSGIFHFPFRINARGEFRQHDASGAGFRYRIYKPFLLRRDTSPLTSDIPQALWPDFAWHDSIRGRTQGEPTSPVEMHYSDKDGVADWYDGLRVDIWGPTAQDRLEPFVLSFMRWLRMVSLQPWISDVDHHSPSELKRFFEISTEGLAISEVYPVSSIRIAKIAFVTDAMWQQAFEIAASGRETPLYANLFYDAINASARDDYDRAIMNLAMALESCRDQNFSKIHEAEDLELRGPQLKRPFNHTDLLMHLTKDSQQAFGRDFSVENPTHWPHLRNLYIARHHVAHGKGAVFSSQSGLKRVDKDSFSLMQIAAAAALDWMEALVKERSYGHSAVRPAS